MYHVKLDDNMFSLAVELKISDESDSSLIVAEEWSQSDLWELEIC